MKVLVLYYYQHRNDGVNDRDDLEQIVFMVWTMKGSSFEDRRALSIG